MDTPWGLTPTEFEVGRLLGEGLTVYEVGEALCLASKTISEYIRRGRLKMGAKNTHHYAVIIAVHLAGVEFDVT